MRNLFNFFKQDKALFVAGDKIKLKLDKICYYAPEVGQSDRAHKQTKVLATDTLKYSFESNLYYYFVVYANRDKNDKETAENQSTVYISKDSFLAPIYERID